MLFGLNEGNATAGNAVKAALLSTMFNLRKGCQVLDAQGYPRTELVLTGGLTLTPELGQILADVFNVPVKLLESADEGTGWGAALLAKFCQLKQGGATQDWSSFLASLSTGKVLCFKPDAEEYDRYEAVYQRYCGLLEKREQLDQIVQR